MIELTHRDWMHHALLMYVVAVLSAGAWSLITRDPWFAVFAFVLGALPVDPRSFGGRRWAQALLVFLRGGLAAGLWALLGRVTGMRP